MKKKQSIYNLIVILTTESDYSKANLLANIILERKLAACISFKNIAVYFENYVDAEIESDFYNLLINRVIFSKIEDRHSLDAGFLLSS